MAIKYCWSGATGAANGTSWSDAYTGIEAAVAASTPGTDVIYVHTGATNTHFETFATSKTPNIGSVASGRGQLIIGVDKDNSNAYTKSASVNYQVTGAGNDLTFNNAVEIYGLYFECPDRLNLSIGDQNEVGRCVDCTFISTSGQLYFSGEDSIFINCDLSAGTNFNTQISTYIGGTLTSTTAGGTISGKIYGVDLTGSADNAFSDVGRSNFIGCKVNSGTIINGSGAATNSADLFATAPSGGNWYTQVSDRGYRGAISLTDSVYRDGGATFDGTNEYSYCIETNVAGVDVASQWNEHFISSTGSKTFTVEIASTTTLTDDNVRLELMYFANSGDTQMKIISSATNATTSIPMGDPTQTPANIPSSSETWTGITETAQKMSVTVTVNQIGPVRWRVISRTTTDVYFCPKISVT